MAYMRNPCFGFKGKKIKLAGSSGGGGGGGGGGTNYAQFTGGHYILMNVNRGARTNNIITGATGGTSVYTSYTTVLSEIKARPALAGAQCRIYWNQLERNTKAAGPDDYDFSLVGQVLDDFANTTKVGSNKKVMFLFAVSEGTGVAADAAHVVPNYMLSVTADKQGPGSDGVDYDGGQWGYDGAGSDGYRVRLANNNVLTRFNLMLSALASYIRNHPNYAVFESMAFSESAIGNALAGWTEPSETLTLQNAVAAAKTFDAGVPERMTHMMINYPTSTSAEPGIEYLVEQSYINKFGFGSPDVFWDNSGLWRDASPSGYGKGCMQFMKEYTGARIASVQAQDQWCTMFPAGSNSRVCPSPGHVPTFLENYNNCVNILNAHYVIWQRATEDDPHYATNVHIPLSTAMLDFFTTSRPLNTTRPALWKTY